VGAFSDSLTFVFAWSVPALVGAFLLTWFAREHARPA
jgi:hypothetical protein